VVLLAELPVPVVSLDRGSLLTGPPQLRHRTVSIYPKACPLLRFVRHSRSRE
jgi:hypothetical protein